MLDYDAQDSDDNDRWKDCGNEEDEEEGIEIPPYEGSGQLQTNDSGCGNHLEICSMEEGSELV